MITYKQLAENMLMFAEIYGDSAWHYRRILTRILKTSDIGPDQTDVLHNFAERLSAQDMDGAREWADKITI